MWRRRRRRKREDDEEEEEVFSKLDAEDGVRGRGGGGKEEVFSKINSEDEGREEERSKGGGGEEEGKEGRGDIWRTRSDLCLPFYDVFLEKRKNNISSPQRS
ncbi:hypothetical protein M8J77_025740 [Diaphorina citri]|nr:hypothetical protein M8J77_025740 [Diaphorina citri]